MHNFLDNDLVLNYPSVGDEGRLCGGDEFVEERSELGDEQLGNDFVHNIAHIYGSEMVSRCGFRDLRNEYNKGTVYLPRHKAS